MTEFPFSEPCDWAEPGEDSCGETPTKYVGDIYYSCEKHIEEFEEFLGIKR